VELLPGARSAHLVPVAELLPAALVPVAELLPAALVPGRFFS